MGEGDEGFGGNRRYGNDYGSTDGSGGVFLGILSILAVGGISVYLSVPTVCTTPPIPPRGRLSISVPTSFAHYAAYNETTRIPAGAVASYRCVSGYTLEGSEQKTCLENGAWLPPTPISCVKDN